MRNYRTVQIHEKKADKNPLHKIPPHVEALQAMVDEVEDQLKEGIDQLEEKKPTDLDAFNRGLLEVGVSVFGKSRTKGRLQRSYMYKSKVRKQQQARGVWEKRLDRARKRNRIDDIALAKEELKKADKNWIATRRNAQREQWDDFITKVTNGKLSDFYSMFQRVRMKKPPRTPTTHLDPTKTANFFSSLYASHESAKAVIDSLPVYVEEEAGEDDATRVSVKEVKRACKQLKASCSGADGVPPELLSHLCPSIQEVLADMFTKCLREGLPAGLRHGLITLLAKTSPPSKDPAKYRPITLLPACVRLLLRVVDNKLRDFIKDNPQIISIPNEQGGFMPNRNTHLQAFLLLLLRDFTRHKKQALYVAFLDVEKAFDTIDHMQLLDVLRKIGIPEDLVHVIHRLLPSFNLEVMGALFQQEQGTFQGSPLSPLLCVLFLMDLILYINGDEASAFHGIQLPWDATKEELLAMLKILLFADDIAILASTPEQLQKALDLMALWAKRRGLRWGHAKCKVLRLCRQPSDKTTREELAKRSKMQLDGHVLDWVSEFTYLGMMVLEAPEYGRCLPNHLPTDENKIRGLCIALHRMFPSTARCTRVAPLAARLGVLQVVHAKFLYPTALLDIDYKRLDVQTNRLLRRLCGLPLCSPSVLIHADLGVWPSRYYAHQRALNFLGRARWAYWTKDGFQQWFDDAEPGAIPKCLLPKWATRGVLARFGCILKRYGLSWNDLREAEVDTQWKQRVANAIQVAFEKDCKKAAARHGHPLLEFPQPTRRPRIRHCLRMGGDLALTALRMRCPRLRLVPSRPLHDHGTCRYCRVGSENGFHLVVCPSLPVDLSNSRDSIIQAIAGQARVPVGATRHRKAAIQDYIMNFAWPNMSDDLLKRLLVFCRNLINKYAAFEPAWESPDMASFPVHRVRPVLRPPSNDV
jgi:hypothetical protein